MQENALTGDPAEPVRIGAERGGRESCLVIEVTYGIHGPAIANRSRLADLSAGNDDIVAVDLRVPPDEMAVFARDGKAL
jgi:hypothetical protein